MAERMKNIFLVVFFVLMILSGARPAHAYLDPGSGSILIYTLLGIFVTVIYALRGAAYRVRQLVLGRVTKKERESAEAEIVFYSEGRNYWNVFAPIIKALDNKGVKCVYVTPDKKDPGLQYISGNVINKLLNSGLKAITYMNHVTANVVVSTTPQLDVYMLKRSNNVKHYTHVVHAPTDVGFYEKHSLDYYDSVLCSGPHQIKSIRTLEKKRGSKNKQLYETGCTYYDVMAEEVNKINSSKGKKLTVLYAPTWGRVSSLVKYGNRILKPLLNDKFNLIFRPHPQMFNSYKDLMDELTSFLKAHESTTLDREPSGLISMASSDIMVSDISGIMFDYAFLFCKPIVAIDTVAEPGGYEAEDLEEDWGLKIRPKLCRTVKDSDIPQLADIILEEVGNFRERKLMISEIKNQFVYNFCNAGEVAAKQLIEINNNLNGK